MDTTDGMDDMTLNARMRHRRALVTGCAGFVGSHLTERLLDEGWDVVGLDCFTPFYSSARKRANIDAALEHTRFTMHQLDLATDPLDHALDGVDVVFHLAAQAGVRGSFGETFGEYVRNNITATQRLLEAAVRRDVGCFVYASSSSVYGDNVVFPTPEAAPLSPISPYGMTKVATEELAAVYTRTAGIRTVGLRYFTLYGPRQRPDMAFSLFLTAALGGRAIPLLGDGSQMRDFTYVADGVGATIAAADLTATGASVYNVGGGRPVALIDVVELIGELVGTQPLIDRGARQMGDAVRTGADLSRAERDLGYRPVVSLVEGLQTQLEWLVCSERVSTTAAGLSSAAHAA